MNEQFVELTCDSPFVLFSPRTPNLLPPPCDDGLQDETEARIIVRDRWNVYYHGETRLFERDIYRMIYASRSSKKTTNWFYMGSSQDKTIIKKEAIQPYNLVLGEKLPDKVDPLILKYLFQGLHIFWLFTQRGLGGQVIAKERVISTGKHSFQQGDDPMLNVSSLFLRILIDHYQISTGITDNDAQNSFMEDPEYRFIIFRYLRDVFLNFVKKNSNEVLNETTSDRQILTWSIEILKHWNTIA